MSSINIDVLLADQVTAIDERGSLVTSTYASIGSLVIASGKILACDPFNAERTFTSYSTGVPTGIHPVHLNTVTYQDGDQRVAYATVRFTLSKPAFWKPARIEGKNDLDMFVGYPIDSGMGCFVDVLGLPLLLPKTIDRHAYRDDFSWVLAAMNDYQSEPIHALDEQLNRGENILWAGVTLNAETGMNLLAFHSGWGDGAYPSFFGYDDQGTLTCLTTDFLVL